MIREEAIIVGSQLGVANRFQCASIPEMEIRERRDCHETKERRHNNALPSFPQPPRSRVEYIFYHRIRFV